MKKVKFIYNNKKVSEFNGKCFNIVQINASC